MQNNFNPRSHKGSDIRVKEPEVNKTISIHAPTRGATKCRIWIKLEDAFQSTLPQGERPISSPSPLTWTNFNPRSHKGSDKVKSQIVTDKDDFNPRSHKGSDFFWADPPLIIFGFQSTLPQGERPGHLWKRLSPKRFQSTLPQGERLIPFSLPSPAPYFNPRSHKGSDYFSPGSPVEPGRFQSTLPQGERRTRIGKPKSAILFQSTLPQGERRNGD